MSLYDVMSHAGLAIYAEVALILFFLVFVGIVAWTCLPSRSAELEAAGRQPLDDPSDDAHAKGAAR